MKGFKLFYLILFFVFFLLTSNTFAQDVDTAQPNLGEIIEAGEAIIKIEIEKPQVQLFSQRIKPEFDEVNLEKSFQREIVDEGQTLKVEFIKDEETDRIDIKKLLNRNR